MTRFNWASESFDEFKLMAGEGRVRLNIDDHQWSWLYDQILPLRPWNVFGYKKALLKKMLSSEVTYKKVHDKGIDIVLD
jgi:hypothetical protein